MSKSSDKPYTTYRAGRLRRPRTDVPLEPPSRAPSQEPAESTGGSGARGGGLRRGGDPLIGVGSPGDAAARSARETRTARPAGSAGSAGPAGPVDQPPSIYRADRRAAARRERGDLEPGAPSGRRRRFRWWYLLAIPLALLVALSVWGFLGYTTFDKAVAKSNHRIGKRARAALADSHGSVLSAPTTLLVLGSDRRGHEPARSDSILLMRFDPKTHTVSQLSIPRDTLVDVPGRGQMKINEAFFWGGSPLAIKVISDFTGVPINHVMLVNFHGFPDLIDSVGGVVVDVPQDLTSWYSGNQTVHFKKGPQLMMGQEALVYSRVRHSDSDFMRMGRQQQVVQALEAKIARPRNVFHLPWIGAQFMKGAATDLTTSQIMGLAYIDWRAKGARQYKLVLQGTPEMIGGGSYVVVDPAVKARTVRHFLSH
jgi:polyisoprenyl-teichoic acid--peptidoglycan teichoic acid transferase